ncbi:hypothetical protein ACFV2N_40970 [Streptomyces sp. NPDC059680]|uniref:hypothetical protein n=1 Tax=Streptomyces sp. NPDC059680 TaxID=3346904 RepID=UPI0036CB1B6B
MDCLDLVGIGPFGGAPKKECNETTLMRWRQRITRELQELGHPERAARREGGQPSHLAGIDWRRLLVERTRDRTARTWWLPRAVVRLLDVAEHTETQWLQAARTCQENTGVTEPPGHGWQARSRRRQADDKPRLLNRPAAPVQRGTARPPVLGTQQETRHQPQGGWVDLRRLPHRTRRRTRPLP